MSEGISTSTGPNNWVSLRDLVSYTREEWLEKAVEKLKPLFLAHKYEIPPVKVSCGFPSKGGLSKNRTYGECWQSQCTDDGTRHILITPLLGSERAVEVLGVLAHELTHSVLDDDAKHGPKFKEAMAKVGLEGPAKHAMPGADLQLRLEAIAEELGNYPNVALKPKERKKSEKAAAKKTFKLFCEKKRTCDKHCSLVEKTTGGDFNVNSSRKSLKLGFPMCPCGNEMMMEEEDFELYKLGETT
jgi:hypothetical protein